MNLKTTFVAANVTLDVVARSTKKSGIAVFLRTKTGKEKAKLGMRTIYKAEEAEAAQAKHAELVAGVTAKGWKQTEAKVGSAGRFTAIPDAPTANVAEGEPAKRVGATAPKGDKKKK